MNMWIRSFALTLILAGTALAGGVEDAIKDLGHEDFQKREAATARLSEAGPDAIPALEKAARDADPEVRWRAQKALEAVRARSSSGRPNGGSVAPSAAGEAPGPGRRTPEPPPPALDEAIERARQRLRDIQGEMSRQRPDLRRFLDELERGNLFGGDFGRLFEELERGMKDLNEGRPPVREFGARGDFWSFRFKDGKWEIVRPGDPLTEKLGLRTQPMPPVLKAQLKLTRDAIVIEEVAPNRLAATSGLQQYDVVLSVDGQPVAADGSFSTALLVPGKHTLEIIRAGERTTLTFETPADAIERPTPRAEEEDEEETPAPAPAPEKEKSGLRKY